MSESRASSRYAKALMELSLEQGVLEEVHNDMQMFAQVVAENRALELMLQSPVVPHVRKFAVLSQIFENRVHPISFTIIRIITSKNREELLPDIAREFHRQYNLHKQIQVAEITTTIPLIDSERQEFLRVANQISNKQIELTEKVEPALIGGFVLQIGDTQIDQSVRTKLQRLKYQFVKS